MEILKTEPCLQLTLYNPTFFQQMMKIFNCKGVFGLCNSIYPNFSATKVAAFNNGMVSSIWDSCRKKTKFNQNYPHCAPPHAIYIKKKDYERCSSGNPFFHDWDRDI